MEIEGETIVAAQYSAILDNAVCPLCEMMDGQIFDINDPALPNPPYHLNCRCLLVYIGASEPPENRVIDGKSPPDDLLGQYAKWKLPPPDSLPSYIKTLKGRNIIDVLPIPFFLQPLAKEARKYKSAKEFREAIEKAIEKSRESTTPEEYKKYGSLAGGIPFGNTIYSDRVAISIEEAGFKSIEDFYNQAILKR